MSIFYKKKTGGYIRSIFLLVHLRILTQAESQVVLEKSSPNYEQLAILRSGVESWNEWRIENPKIAIELEGADLSGANLAGVDLNGAKLSNSNLNGANLANADLSGAEMFGTILIGAVLNGAKLESARLFSANLSHARLFRANLTRSGLNDAILHYTYLHESDLTGAYATTADFSNAILIGTILADTVLNGSKFTDALFEPTIHPDARRMIGAIGLDKLNVSYRKGSNRRTIYDIAALILIREDAKKLGLRDLERDLTCSIERISNYNPNQPLAFQSFAWVSFDLTCAYGAAPHRPFKILFIGICLFGTLYALMLKESCGGQLTLEFQRKRNNKETSAPVSRNAIPWAPRGHTRLARFKRQACILARPFRIGLYFSVLSAFNIGYREFNVGSWLQRLQHRPYTLRATGHFRRISGFQSLLGVYLLALWILCNFGRPFG